MKFTNREATQMVESALDDLDYDLDYDLNFPGRKWIESLDEVKTFYEYVYFYAHKKGFKGEESDADGLAKFVFECGNKRNVTLSSLNTLKNWLKKAPPSGSQQGREKVYALCFALGLDASKTEEFFLKAYLERPFNYKNINEAVYFFCLDNGLPYSKAEEMIQKAEEMIQKIEVEPHVKSIDAEQEINTVEVGNAISKMNSEDELIKYLVENRSAFKKQNQTAKAKIKELYEECKELAKKYPGQLHIEGEIQNIDNLLEAITGYNARAIYNGEKVYKTSISKSKLPAAVRKNFPQREQFKQIEQFKQNEKDTASFDVIRKFLIMLKFYHFFANALIENAEELEKNSFFREFVDETNEMLAKCGYVQLYLRNPYDAVFAYCAYGAANPLDEFKNVIYEFYLSDNEDE